jgi:hypothetical protein
MNTNEQIMIEGVRVIATQRYNQGWDVVVEAFTDGDILEYLSNADFDLPKALDDIQAFIDLRKEMEENCQF